MDISSKDFLFDLGFVADAKALDEGERERFEAQLDEGDILIAGYGANFDVDRQNEAFADTKGIEDGLKQFLAGEATLAYHHKHDHVLGKVLAADVVPGKGVRVVARVDKQPESSPLRYLYDQVKKGTLNALSFGGFFKRAITPDGPRIVGADFTELSITGVPVGRGPNFGVVATKALEDLEIPQKPQIDGDIREEDTAQIEFIVGELGRIFDSIGKRAAPADSVVS